jgi:hypothetical protein
MTGNLARVAQSIVTSIPLQWQTRCSSPRLHQLTIFGASTLLRVVKFLLSCLSISYTSRVHSFTPAYAWAQTAIFRLKTHKPRHLGTTLTSIHAPLKSRLLEDR